MTRFPSILCALLLAGCSSQPLTAPMPQAGARAMVTAPATNAVTTNYTLTAGPTLYITNGLIIKIQ